MAMKEEKEHRPKEKRVTLLTPPGATGSGGGASGDSSKGEDKQDRNKEKKEALSKVPGRLLAPERAGRVCCLWRMVGSGLPSPLAVSPSVASPECKWHHPLSSARPKWGETLPAKPWGGSEEGGFPDGEGLGRSWGAITGGGERQERECGVKRLARGMIRH